MQRLLWADLIWHYGAKKYTEAEWHGLELICRHYFRPAATASQAILTVVEMQGERWARRQFVLVLGSIQILSGKAVDAELKGRITRGE